MYHYFTIKSWQTPFVAGTIVGLLMLQIITPTIVYGMNEPTQNTGDQTVETVTPPPAEPVVVEEEEPDPVIPLPETESEDTDPELPEPKTLPEEAEEEDPTPPNDVLMETGDATAGLTLENEVYLTEINTTTSSDDETTTNEPAEDPATSETDPTPEPLVLAPEEVTVTPETLPNTTPAVTLEASSTATSTTVATTSAVTGQNSGSGAGAVTINTGDAVAYTDVLNVVNTNIVNSDGLVKFVNDTLGYQNFDLRDEFELTYAEFDTSQSTPSCNLNNCGSDINSTLSATNTAIIDNNITVIADTGYNQASSDQATINTGDAYASANIINVANTNIVDSNYLLLVFNNFSSFAGDIVLPNSDFFDNILQPSPATNNTTVAVNNSAQITNSVNTGANTGGNLSLGNDSTITTGEAVANSNITDQVNQTISGGSSFSLLIRVHGDWSGSITGLPDGLTWRETDRGIEIISNSNLPTGSPSRSLVQSTNNATINNNVQVFALTGDNEASGNNTTINTGNAYADSSILNIANTNVIGSNWTNLIFTIYGNWSGDLSFGQPNLWLGMTADSPGNPIMPGSRVTYTYTVFNRGDTTASNVRLDNLYESNTLVFADYNEQTIPSSNTQSSWSLGDIRAGETKEFSYVANVNKDLKSSVVSAIPLTSRVTSDQNDADDSDNEEVVTIYVGEHQKARGRSISPTFAAHFDIEKTASRNLAQPGDIVDYTVTFFNRGGQLFDALLVDTLENKDGEIIEQQTWPLGEIKNWETITINYSIEFDSAMETGTYTNYAQLVGFHESRKKKHQTPYESPTAVHTLQLGNLPTAQVLGIQASVCSAYLTEYLRFNATNNPIEVIKLQKFFNNHFATNLSVTGFFDRATEQAVRDFQQEYRDEILTPWGLSRDSGYVYYTTQKKINELACGGLSEFPLATTQQAEMVSFRDKVTDLSRFSFQTTNTPTQPETPLVLVPAIIPPPITKETENLDSPVVQLTPPTLPPEKLKTATKWRQIKSWWQSFTNPPQIALR